MRLSKLFALLPLAGVVSGFIIPDNLPDGMYAATFDANRTATIQEVDGGLRVPTRASSTSAIRSGEQADHSPTTTTTTRAPTPGMPGFQPAATGWSRAQSIGLLAVRLSWLRAITRVSYLTPSLHILQRGYCQLTGFILLPLVDANNWVPPQTVHQFNGIADGAWGSWSTGWVYSDAYQWTFWRDHDGTDFCANMWD